MRFGRDAVLFISGLGGIFYETVFRVAERPFLLVLFASMVGLPAFLYTDEARKQPTAAPPLPQQSEGVQHG